MSGRSLDPGVSVRLAAGLDFSNDIDSWSMTTVAAKVAKTRTLNPEDANWFLVQVKMLLGKVQILLHLLYPKIISNNKVLFDLQNSII